MRSADSLNHHMGKPSFKAGQLAGVLCAVVCHGLFVPGATASGYLPRTGPVPLRFESEATPPPPLVLPPLLMEDAPPAPVVESAAVTPPPENLGPAPLPTPPSAGETNSIVATPETPPTDASAATLDQLFGGAKSNPAALPEPTPSPATQATTASEMLVVTPQMLIEYFKPQAAGTPQAAGVSAFVPVGFAPPTSGTAPASQATYRVQ